MVSPAALDFGTVTAGAPAVSLNLGGSNLGGPLDGDITITAMTVSGPDAGQFATGIGTPITLGVSSTVIIPVIFTADAVPGAKSATLEIVHSGANSPVLVPLTTTVASALVPLVRINAGGGPVTATDAGPNWAANGNLAGGTGYTVVSDGNHIFSQAIPAALRHASIPAYVDNATYEALFLQERYDLPAGPELEYLLPLDNGDYVVNLFIGNSYNGAAGVGDRLFSISLENGLVANDLDIISRFGHQVGGMLTYPVTVADGVLNIRFEHGVIENPFVNAIEVRGLPGSNDPPVVVAPIPNQTNLEGDLVINLAVSASGGNPQENFTYAISGQPQGVTIEPTNGQIFGTIAGGAAAGGPLNDGQYQTIVTVSKPGSPAESVNFSWLVTTPGGTVWTDQTDDDNYTARHECSFVQAGDHFFLFGGRENSSTLDVYDYQNKTWGQGRADAPKPFNHFQAVEYDGLIWVIAAFQDNSFPNEAPAEFIWSYDPANDEWIQGPEIPAARRRGSAGLAVYGGKFYIVGGNTIGHNGGYVNWFDVYDPADGSWTVLVDAPRRRDHFHVSIIGDKLYVAGGRLSGGPGGTFAPLIAEVDVYDLTAQSWSSLPSAQNLPTPRAAAMTANFNDKLYLIGGEIGQDLNGNNVNDALAITESYDPLSQQWTAEADLIQKRHGTQAIVSGGGIHVAAGSPKRGGGTTKKMEYYGDDNPVGSASVAGQLGSPAQVFFTVGSPQSILLTNTGGNVGIVLRGYAISGPDAADFQIVAGNLSSGFIKTGGSQALQLAFTGAGNKTAILEVSYGAASTRQIQLVSSGFYTITATAGANGTITPAGPTTVAAGGNQVYAIIPASGYQVADVTVNGSSVGPVSSYSFTDVQADATISATFSPVAGVNLPPVIGPVSDVIVSAGQPLTTFIQITDEGSPAVTLTIYDISVLGTNLPFLPGATVSPAAYSFVDTGGGLYQLNWNTQPQDGRAYQARITANDGVNPAVSARFEIDVAQGIIGRIESNTFNHPEPWYAGQPQSPYTVTIAANSFRALSYINNNEFVEYLIDVPAAGTYNLLVAAAKGIVSGPGGVTTITFSQKLGANFAPIGSVGVVLSPQPAAWNNYQDYSTQVTFANAGPQTLRLDFNSAVNVDYFEFNSVAAASYGITATAGANGSISPAGLTTVAAGGGQDYAITPNVGYEVANVLVNGSSVGPVSSYSFANVQADATIQALFSPITATTYTITATAGANGSISPMGITTVAAGAGQAYTITPIAGYEVANVLVNGASVGAVASYTFANVQASASIQAIFNPIATASYSIIATAGANGSISPTGLTTVAAGGGQTYAITPAAGYEVASVLVNGSSIGPVSTYSFTNVQADATISSTFSPLTTVNLPPVIGPVADLVVAAGATATAGIQITDEATPSVSLIIYDVSILGTNLPFLPGAAVSPSAYSFVNTGGNLYQLTWNTQPQDGRAYQARITADDGVNPAVTTTFEIDVAQPVIGRIESNTFTFPEPWYTGQPQSPYTVTIAANSFRAISYINNNEFVEYLIDVPVAGTYELLVAAAKGIVSGPGGVTTITFSERVAGSFNPIGSVGVVKSPPPGSWNNYQPHVTQVTFANSGSQTLRLDFNSAVNVDYFEFSAAPIARSQAGATDSEGVDEMAATAVSAADSEAPAEVNLPGWSGDESIQPAAFPALPATDLPRQAAQYRLLTLSPNQVYQLEEISGRGIRSVTIYSLYGQVMGEHTFDYPARIDLPTDRLPTGTYLVVVNGEYRHKFLIVR